MEDIIATHPTGDVVVVAHGGRDQRLLRHILGIRDQDMFFLPENTSLNTVVIRGEERLAWFLSDAIAPHRSRVVRASREWERDVAEGLTAAAYTRRDNRPPNARESITVSVKFLSTEWAEAVKAQLNGNDAFRRGRAGPERPRSSR